jgi:hypothetical protein
MTRTRRLAFVTLFEGLGLVLLLVERLFRRRRKADPWSP